MHFFVVLRMNIYCIHAGMYVCMHACMSAYMYVFMSGCMHVCVYVFMYVCMYVCMHACTYMYICRTVDQAERCSAESCSMVCFDF